MINIFKRFETERKSEKDFFVQKLKKERIDKEKLYPQTKVDTEANDK